jgi:hypothetical protein
MSAFTESIVEDAALAWLKSMGYAVLHLPARHACVGHADMQSNAAREAGGPSAEHVVETVA